MAPVSWSTRRLIPVTAGALMLVWAALAYGQQIWVGGGRGYGRYPPRWAAASDCDGGFIYCRGYYTSRWREQSGSGWNTDYPGADNNFPIRLAELTRVRVKFDMNRQPHHVVVSLTDPLLFRCPLLFMEDIGTVEFSPDEVLRLREYFMKADFSGSTARGVERMVQLDFAGVPGPAADGVPGLRHPVDPRDHAHALRRVRNPAGPGHQLLGAKWPAIDLGAGLGQRPGILQRDSGLARPPHGRDDPQHRHRGYVGA